MVTWAGALVEIRGRDDLPAIVAKHRIEAVDCDACAPWLLVWAGVNFAHLTPPKFIEALSRELHAQVIGFFLQSAASVEEIQHFDDGRLVRHLEYSADAGGWIKRIGSPQSWEAAYFFADDEGVDEGEAWPMNLGDELTDDELARYREARERRDASPVMDLLSAGDASSIQRLLRQFGVDPEKPGAHFTPPPNRKPMLLVAGFVVLLVVSALLGVLTAR